MPLPKKIRISFYSFLVYGPFEVKSESPELIENITYAVFKLNVTTLLVFIKDCSLLRFIYTE